MATRKPSGKPKALTYELIEPASDSGLTLYRMLSELIDTRHEHLREARIALLWCTNWKEDVDGNVTIGKTKLATDVDRELAPYDFAIMLSRAFMEDGLVTDVHRQALIDHELCHCRVKCREDGEPEYDPRGRMKFRLAKHDVEEFSANIEAFGVWKHNLETFASALDRGRHRDPRFWLGASVVHDALRGAGVTVPLDVVASWTQEEKAEAQEWATLRTELARLPGVDPVEPPDFVSDAANRDIAQ